ncbi:pantetheine-phosphate adenylyltransferase [Calidifontibacter sp. DB0510]|uniref:Phosphopantetheine adenylyltransferase n=1 Tax=Metallococcus carri TaxID=1656884 RepID=A0A967E7T0_9MICO|nr:pantetheine-phosphate adenylyltransferase [Metallococcus carri]NHN54467.1 pantetheine-phosphate adenylyltransferase [Metallococcus carri]NOP36694.1 pantetheine-phosphate adenylyltransferase [Calidifontibacter sp. DB2511S]
MSTLGTLSGDPRRCVCPGSYDPITMGHLDVLERAARLYDEVVVAVLFNPDKQGTFSPEERLGLIEESVAHLPNVRAQSFGRRLVVDVCQELDAGVLLKGLRSNSDWDYELPMAQMNRELSGVETMFLPGNPALSHYSSSLIRTCAALGADVSAMVPPPVLQPLLARLRPAGLGNEPGDR